MRLDAARGPDGMPAGKSTDGRGTGRAALPGPARACVSGGQGDTPDFTASTEAPVMAKRPIAGCAGRRATTGAAIATACADVSAGQAGACPILPPHFAGTADARNDTPSSTADRRRFDARTALPLDLARRLQPVADLRAHPARSSRSGSRPGAGARRRARRAPRETVPAGPPARTPRLPASARRPGTARPGRPARTGSPTHRSARARAPQGPPRTAPAL